MLCEYVHFKGDLKIELTASLISRAVARALNSWVVGVTLPVQTMLHREYMTAAIHKEE